MELKPRLHFECQEQRVQVGYRDCPANYECERKAAQIKSPPTTIPLGPVVSECRKAGSG
jgi:hypothetical protein